MTGYQYCVEQINLCDGGEEERRGSIHMKPEVNLVLRLCVFALSVRALKKPHARDCRGMSPGPL